MASAKPQDVPIGRYLYERLGDKRFQELCNALLVEEFRGGRIQCFPVGHSDGGRDALRREGERAIIYQVKWTGKAVKSPVAWLEGAIKGEAKKIERLVADGATEYFLMTNLGGTAVPGRGTMDRLDAVLAEHSKVFGIPMKCWWRADIDARVDSSSRELKWSFSEMLAGNDLIRHLIEADRAEIEEGKLQNLVLKLMAAQENEDARVKFKRVELDLFKLADLFVDVEAYRLGFPNRENPRTRDPYGVMTRTQIGGAARYLLGASRRWTLVTGEPGQGKSTLGQFICQVHRNVLLGTGDPKLQPAAPPNIRVPIRLDLRDYAVWLHGENPFDGTPSKPRRQLRSSGAIEEFLVPFIAARIGGLSCDISTVHEILERYPVLVVLDGLDEVAQTHVRQRVVEEIDGFAARLGATSISPQLVVSTRPNSSHLPEPSADLFETLSLAPLSDALRTSYLRKWADANHVRGSERRALERTFRERSAEPHIALLADNPMQLSILLYLIHKRGNSVPTGRTALYSSYMETLLDREGEKTRSIIERRPELEEITAYLGWHLQAIAEAESGNGRLPIKALKRAILDYLFDVDKDTSLVDDLFTTVTDRVWALTSKIQGTFEFDVQPIREYFAAKFLHDFAGADAIDFDSADVLRQLVRRAYWLNTSRFFVGFATPNELAGLVSGLADEFENSDHARQVRSATWALLTDGVFAGRTRAQKEAVRLLTADLSLVLLEDLSAETEFAKPAPAHGGDQLNSILREDVVRNPGDALAPKRLRLLATLSSDSAGYRTWWREQMVAATGSDEELRWLTLGSIGTAGAKLTALEADDLGRTSAHFRAILNAGVAPAPGSSLESELVAAVVAGQCSDCDPEAARGFPGDLLRVIAPSILLSKTTNGAPFAVRSGHDVPEVSSSRRSSSLARLKNRDERFEKVQSALRFSRGEKGSTFPWANSARELATIFGPCWLAAEIAVIGASASSAGLLAAASAHAAGAEAFGPRADYGSLLQQLRANRSNVDWWKSAFGTYPDNLSRGTWSLALLCVADEEVVHSLQDLLEQAVADLTEGEQYALLSSSSRIGAAGVARRITQRAALHGETLIVSTLLSHHSIRLAEDDELSMLSTEALASMSQFGDFGWPALRALGSRVAMNADVSALAGLREYGASARTDVPYEISNLRSVAGAILRDPSHYPGDWVLRAENDLSKAASDLPLASVAAKEQWLVSLR